MRARAALVLVAVFVALVVAERSNARTERVTLDGPAWVPPLIRRLAVCESRGNPQHHVWNGEGEFGGIVSWAISTWRLDRYPGMPMVPYRASLRQQVRVARRSLERGRYFGCLQHGWVRG